MEERYLYKAKRTDNGEWVQGYLSYPSCTKNGNESYYFYAKDSLGCFCRCVVDSSTICQCTGLKDKNGKLIWENDIVRTCWQDNEAQCEEIAQIAWDEFGYYPWLDEYHCDGCDLFNEVLEIEVIGNIFDNPELLESEE